MLDGEFNTQGFMQSRTVSGEDFFCSKGDLYLYFHLIFVDNLSISFSSSSSYCPDYPCLLIVLLQLMVAFSHWRLKKTQMSTDSWNDVFCLVSDSRLHLLPDPASKALTESDFIVLRTRQIWGGNRLVKWKKKPAKHARPQNSPPKKSKAKHKFSNTGTVLWPFTGGSWGIKETLENWGHVCSA